jgi:hypothetical protein
MAAKWISARELCDTDVFRDMDGGPPIPIDKLTRYPGGYVEVIVTMDGSRHQLHYGPAEQVCVADVPIPCPRGPKTGF